MVVGSSWDALLGTSFLDEISLILLIICAMIFRIKISKVPLVCLFVYSLVIFIGLLRGYGNITEGINYIKCLVVIVLLPSIGLTDNDTNKILKIYKYTNALSALVGIVNYVCYNILHRSLIFESGNLKYIDGVLVHRMAGFCSFSGVMAVICLSLLVLDLFKKNKKISDYLWVCFWLLSIYCTKGRLPLYLSICIIVIYVCTILSKKIGKKFILAMLAICALIGLIFVPNIFEIILSQFAEDFENQIRWKAYIKINDIFSTGIVSILNLLFGLGCGYLGTYYESHFAITLVETGLVGLIVWYIPLCYYLYKIIKSKGIYKNKSATIIIVTYYLLNIFMNKSYDVPYLPIMCILLNGVNIKNEKFKI